MASTVYQDWARGLLLGFNGPTNQALWSALAKAVGDNSLDDMQSAALQRLPQYATAEANALTADDRGFEKGPGESAADFAARLVAAPAIWKLAGSPLGMLITLVFEGFGRPIIVQQNGLGFRLTDDPTLPDLSTVVPVFTSQPSWFDSFTLGLNNSTIPASTDGKPAIPTGTVPWWTFDSSMDAEGNQYNSRFALLFVNIDPGFDNPVTLSRFWRVVNAWKPAKARCVYAAVIGGEVWDWPIDTWDDPVDTWDDPLPTVDYFYP